MNWFEVCTTMAMQCFLKYGYLNLRGPDVLVILLVAQEAPPPASQLAMFVPKLQS